MMNGLARTGSFTDIVKSAHLTLSALSTGISLSSPNTTFAEKGISIVTNMLGSALTLPPNLLRTYLMSSTAIATLNFGYSYLQASDLSLPSSHNATAATPVNYLENKIYKITQAVTVGYQSIFATATSLAIYKRLSKNRPDIENHYVYQYTGAFLTLFIPFFYNELSRKYSAIDYAFMSFPNIIANMISYGFLFSVRK